MNGQERDRSSGTCDRRGDTFDMNCQERDRNSGTCHRRCNTFDINCMNVIEIVARATEEAMQLI